MVSGRPSGRGDLSSVTDPSHYPSSFRSLQKDTSPQKVIYNGTASEDTYTDPIEVGQCEGFTIYVHGTGDWNVQYSPHPNNPESFWVDSSASDYTDSGFLAVTSRHPWTRVLIKSGASLIVWIYRKYATY
jgi:hypothetical protein